jgi:hypothetical protein
VEGGRGLANDRYNLACCWALYGDADSAFYNLFAIAQLADYRDYFHLMSDEDLKSLHQYRAWNVLRTQVLANKRRHDPAADTALANQLEDVLLSDQQYRKKLDAIYHRYGEDSREAKTLWDTIKNYDAQNLKRITSLLDTRGWMPRQQIGASGVNTIFLVLQHADSTTQFKYLPMLRKAVSAGDLPKDDFALFDDRTRLAQGRKQLYGSQIMCRNDSCYVLPLEDPMHVDERRRAMNLQPLAEYVKYWNITWNAAAYSKKQEEAGRSSLKH